MKRIGVSELRKINAELRKALEKIAFPPAFDSAESSLTNAFASAAIRIARAALRSAGEAGKV